MASPDLIKNAARWLAGYFSLIDVSEAWINNEIFSISLIFIFKWISDEYIERNIFYGLLLLINSYLNRKYT